MAWRFLVWQVAEGSHGCRRTLLTVRAGGVDRDRPFLPPEPVAQQHADLSGCDEGFHHLRAAVGIGEARVDAVLVEQVGDAQGEVCAGIAEPVAQQAGSPGRRRASRRWRRH